MQAAAGLEDCQAAAALQCKGFHVTASLTQPLDYPGAAMPPPFRAAANACILGAGGACCADSALQLVGLLAATVGKPAESARRQLADTAADPPPLAASQPVLLEAPRSDAPGSSPEAALEGAALARGLGEPQAAAAASEQQVSFCLTYGICCMKVYEIRAM